jgi:hypothetical protein
MASFRGTHGKKAQKALAPFLSGIARRAARSSTCQARMRILSSASGASRDTLGMLATVTSSELAALYGDVGSTGSLVYHLGTYTAYLDDIDGHEIVDADLYAVNLSFIRQ